MNLSCQVNDTADLMVEERRNETSYTWLYFGALGTDAIQIQTDFHTDGHYGTWCPSHPSSCCHVRPLKLI